MNPNDSSHFPQSIVQSSSIADDGSVTMRLEISCPGSSITKIAHMPRDGSAYYSSETVSPEGVTTAQMLVHCNGDYNASTKVETIDNATVKHHIYKDGSSRGVIEERAASGSDLGTVRIRYYPT
jgi:hypothetical protein